MTEVSDFNACIISVYSISSGAAIAMGETAGGCQTDYIVVSTPRYDCCLD